MSTTAFRTCPLCEATCGLAIELDDEHRITAVRGDEEDVFSHGFICPKGANLAALEEDPDRLRQPHVKRDGVHHAVSWDEAFELIQRRLPPILERSRQAVAVYAGNPNVHNLSGALFGRALFKALRTRNLFTASTVDQMPKHVSCGLLFGHPLTIPIPDLDRTHTLLMLGANPLASNGSLCTAPDFPGRLRALKARGGRLIVVDPRRTRTARKADEHLFIRPGTDAALLLAIAHTLLRENLTRTDALAPHLQGLDALSERILRFSPEALARHCGVPLDAIERTARALHSAPSAAVYGRLGTSTVAFGTLTSALVDVLNLLTGNLDRPGGVLFTQPAHSRHRPDADGTGRGFLLGRWTSRVEGLPEAMSELPVATLAAEIDTDREHPDAVRALITVAGNPVLSTPNSARLDAALASLDFMVSVDPYLNETTRHADVILPPPTHLTAYHYDLSFYALAIRNIANASPPLRPLPEGALPEHTILLKLALIASGQPHDTPTDFLEAFIIRGLVEKELQHPQSPLRGASADALLAELSQRSGPERVLDWLLRSGPYGDHFGRNPGGLSLAHLEAHPHGVDLGPLTPRLPGALSTPSGRVELSHPALDAELDRLERTLDDPPPPLVLIGRRHLRSNNSWMHNIPKLVGGSNRCTLLIHPDDAAAHGVEDGAAVTVTSRVGAVTLPAELTADIMPGVVSIPHGWGHGMPGTRAGVAAQHAGVNTNLLTDEQQLDPLSGNAVLSGVPVSIEASA